jgi:hypothetical protein
MTDLVWSGNFLLAFASTVIHGPRPHEIYDHVDLEEIDVGKFHFLKFVVL